MTFRRSLYVRILVASFAAAAISGFAFAAIFLAISKPGFERIFRGYHQMQAEEAARAWDAGGARALEAYLSTLGRTLEARYYLTDRTGRDLLDGTDRSDLIGTGRRGEPHPVGNGLLAVTQASSNARYQLIFVAPPPFGLSNVLPYYALILVAIALLCWWLAVGIATPLRDLAQVAEQFGRGAWKGQVPYARRTDEVGDLARSLAEMADRIDTLLTAERRLLTDISHEVRSPLARLSMAIELLRTAPDRAAAADRAEKEVQQLTTLVESLVDITRVEGDPSRTLTDVVDISGVVAEVVDSLQTDAASRGSRLDLRSDGELVIRGRRELLRSAFDNVIQNALRYAPGGTAIEISVRAEPEAAVVSVRDFGPGVSAQDLPRLATPFFRSEPARDARTGGVGLGLALARRAVLVHHGTFAAMNAEPGLRISMRFPTRA